MTANEPKIPLSIVTKPTGAACNLDCSYCFFLSKELLYDHSSQKMSLDTLKSYVREFLDVHPDGPVTMLWQGGEPTLRGIDFFKNAVDLAHQFKRPAQVVSHAIQTNGTLINAQWAQFFADHDFLVGISIDGPAQYHDRFRTNRAGHATHSQVIRGWNFLQEAHVKTNVLCTVHQANQDHPLEVYRYFRDELHADFIQFIPIVERVNENDLGKVLGGWNAKTGLLYQQAGHAVTSRSVQPVKYGEFLSTVFDEWIRHDIGDVFVQDFDSALAGLFFQPTVCVHAPECGNNIALEFNGDVYTCDHWVEPDWKLGNLTKQKLTELLDSPVMKTFAKKKRQELPRTCLSCPVLTLCNGGCPKDRFVLDAQDPQADPTNYLCQGYYSFYTHIKPDLLAMAHLLRIGESAVRIKDPQVRSLLKSKIK